MPQAQEIPPSTFNISRNSEIPLPTHDESSCRCATRPTSGQGYPASCPDDESSCRFATQPINGRATLLMQMPQPFDMFYPFPVWLLAHQSVIPFKHWQSQCHPADGLPCSCLSTVRRFLSGTRLRKPSSPAAEYYSPGWPARNGRVPQAQDDTPSILKENKARYLHFVPGR